MLETDSLWKCQRNARFVDHSPHVRTKELCWMKLWTSSLKSELIKAAIFSSPDIWCTFLHPSSKSMTERKEKQGRHLINLVVVNQRSRKSHWKSHQKSQISVTKIANTCPQIFQKTHLKRLKNEEEHRFIIKIYVVIAVC